MRAIVAEFLGQAEVDGVDQIALFAETHQKIVRLYITVDKVLSVNKLDSANL